MGSSPFYGKTGGWKQPYPLAQAATIPGFYKIRQQPFFRKEVTTLLFCQINTGRFQDMFQPDQAENSFFIPPASPKTWRFIMPC